MIQRFWKWLLADILDARTAELRGDIRQSYTASQMDTAQAASIANKELQSLSQELHDQREADNAASGAEIAVLKAESQSTILALQQEIVSLKQRQADDWEASCVGLHSLDAHHAESIEALRKDLIARIESLINTIAIVNDNSTKAASSVQRI